MGSGIGHKALQADGRSTVGFHQFQMAATMTDQLKDFSSPERIAEAGERLYSERYKATFEREKPGEYVAIDVVTGNAYVGKYPEEALTIAKAEAPTALLHLIRIGSLGAYRVSHLLYGNALAGGVDPIPWTG